MKITNLLMDNSDLQKELSAAKGEWFEAERALKFVFSSFDARRFIEFKLAMNYLTSA